MKFCIVSVFKYQCHTMDVPNTKNGVMKTKQRNGNYVTDRARDEITHFPCPVLVTSITKRV